MKRVLYLVMVALVAMLILAPTAMAQETTAQQKVEQKVETTVEKDLPKSGGAPVGSILLPAAALLVGGGVLGYAVLRRR
jgi:Na+/H+ antiporter NhaC